MDPDSSNEEALRDEQETQAQEEPPGYETRVVAYLDVLGTREAIARSAANEKAFFEASGPFGSIYGFLARMRNLREEKRTTILATGFSDHVVLSAPATTAGVREILEKAHGLFGSLLFQNNRLLRGGVVVGQLYHQAEIIFGPALVEAYRLESQARYPRIVAEGSVIDLGGGIELLQTGDVSSRSPHMEEDGNLYFLHPLRTVCASCDPKRLRHRLQKKAKELLNEAEANLQDKGAWLADLLISTPQ